MLGQSGEGEGLTQRDVLKLGLLTLNIANDPDDAMDALRRAVENRSVPGTTQSAVATTIAALCSYANVITMRRSVVPIRSPVSEILLETAAKVVRPPSMTGVIDTKDKRTRERELYTQVNELLPIAFALTHALEVARSPELMGAQHKESCNQWLQAALQGLMQLIADLNLERVRLFIKEDVASSVLRAPSVGEHFLDSVLHEEVAEKSRALLLWQKASNPKASKPDAAASRPVASAAPAAIAAAGKVGGGGNNNNNSNKKGINSPKRFPSPKRNVGSGGRGGRALGTPAKQPNSPAKPAPSN